MPSFSFGKKKDAKKSKQQTVVQSPPTSAPCNNFRVTHSSSFFSWCCQLFSGKVGIPCRASLLSGCEQNSFNRCSITTTTVIKCYSYYHFILIIHYYYYYYFLSLLSFPIMRCNHRYGCCTLSSFLFCCSFCLLTESEVDHFTLRPL